MAAHVTVIILGHAMAGMTLVISVIYLLARLWEAAASASEGLRTDKTATASNGIDRCNLIAVQLAAAMRDGCAAGRNAWLAGRMPKGKPSPSSPPQGVIEASAPAVAETDA